MSSGLCSSRLREAGSVFLLHSHGLDPSEPGLRLTPGECFWLRKAASSLRLVSPWVSLVPGADGEWLPHPGSLYPWGPVLGPRRRSSKHCLPSSLLVRGINVCFRQDRLLVVISNPQMSVTLNQHKDFLITSHCGPGCSGVLLRAVCGTPVPSSLQLWTPLGSQLRWTK